MFMLRPYLLSVVAALAFGLRGVAPVSALTSGWAMVEICGEGGAPETVVIGAGPAESPAGSDCCPCRGCRDCLPTAAALALMPAEPAPRDLELLATTLPEGRIPAPATLRRRAGARDPPTLEADT